MHRKAALYRLLGNVFWVHDFFPRLSRWNEDFVDFTFGCYVKWRANTRDIRFTVSLLWFDIISPNCYSHMSVLHFVEQSPDPWPTKKQKKGKKEKKSDRKTSAICIRSISAISSFPPLRAEENRKIDFSADGSGGKAANSSFPPLRAEENWKSSLPPMGAAVKLQIPTFPPLRAEENWKVRFTADGSGGNAAIPSFPPPGAEENFKMRV